MANEEILTNEAVNEEELSSGRRIKYLLSVINAIKQSSCLVSSFIGKYVIKIMFPIVVPKQ